MLGTLKDIREKIFGSSVGVGCMADYDLTRWKFNSLLVWLTRRINWMWNNYRSRHFLASRWNGSVRETVEWILILFRSHSRAELSARLGRKKTLSLWNDGKKLIPMSSSGDGPRWGLETAGSTSWNTCQGGIQKSDNKRREKHPRARRENAVGAQTEAPVCWPLFPLGDVKRDVGPLCHCKPG